MYTNGYCTGCGQPLGNTFHFCGSNSDTPIPYPYAPHPSYVTHVEFEDLKKRVKALEDKQNKLAKSDIDKIVYYLEWFHIANKDDAKELQDLIKKLKGLL